MQFRVPSLADLNSGNRVHANRTILDSNATYENQSTVAAELIITVDRTEILHVVDVITFNSEGKIESIRAYLGRGDKL